MAASKAQHLRCKFRGCMEQPVSVGLCKKHYEISEKAHALRQDAIELLHRWKVDDAVLKTPALLDEFRRLNLWWTAACDSVNNRRRHPVLRDEAEPALEWCISLAQAIIIAERKARLGDKSETPELEDARQHVWERFGFLEKGLRSNGTSVN